MLGARQSPLWDRFALNAEAIGATVHTVPDEVAACGLISLEYDATDIGAALAGLLHAHMPRWRLLTKRHNSSYRRRVRAFLAALSPPAAARTRAAGELSVRAWFVSVQRKVERRSRTTASDAGQTTNRALLTWQPAQSL